MALVTPAAMRSTVSEAEDGLKIIIQAAKNWLAFRAWGGCSAIYNGLRCVVEHPLACINWNVLGMAGGSLAFDFGARTYHWGLGIEAAEAYELLRRIGQYYPRLIGQSKDAEQ